MIGHPYYIDAQSVGTRFLLGKPTWAKFEDQRPWLDSAWIAATRLFTIESVAGREMWARDHLGEIRRFDISNHLGVGAIAGSETGNVLWINNLPNGDFGEIAAFADAMTSERHGKRPFAFFVKKVAPRAVTVNLICFADPASGYVDEKIMAAEGDLIGNAFVGRDFEMDPGDHEWAEGSFIVAKGFSIRHDGDGKLVAEACQIVTVLENTDIDAIAAWLPDMGPPSDRRFIFSTQSTPLAIVHDFVMECDRAIARSEPNRALFYWFPDNDDVDGSSTSGVHLGSEGITFFDVDSIADYFYGDNQPHGLWIIEDAKWWSSESMGEHDSGIDGDWRRATAEDVAHFGFGIDDLNRELADIREIDLDPELAQQLLSIVDEPLAPAQDSPVCAGKA